MPPPPLASDLDAIAEELVMLYRHAVKNAPGEDAIAAALSLSRALEAIGRVKRSTHPENAYDVAVPDIEEARLAMTRLTTVRP